MVIAKRYRRGVTLIETISIAVCISIFVSLAMPYLVHLRSQDERIVCANRVRQVTLAAHNFHDAYKRLPPATIGYSKAVESRSWADNPESEVYWKKVQNTSSLALTMPFMELMEHYRKISPIAFDMYTRLADYPERGRTEFEWQGAITGIDEVYPVSIDDFLCPADDLNDQSIKAIIATQPCVPVVDETPAMDATDLAGDIAIQYWPGKNDGGPKYTNYIACFGAMGGKALSDDEEDQRWVGAMTSRNRVTLETVTDGTSRTFMYGESLGEIVDGERTAAMSWIWGGGGRVSGHLQPHKAEHPINDEIKIFGNSRQSSGIGFGSKHKDTVNFAFCDGSVHAISTDIDIETLYQLASMKDGGTPIDF